jgi:hypothetical protein
VSEELHALGVSRHGDLLALFRDGVLAVVPVVVGAVLDAA